MVSTILKIVNAIAQMLQTFFQYKIAKMSDKSEIIKEEKEKEEKAYSKVEDVCNNGSIADLLDATTELGKLKK